MLSEWNKIPGKALYMLCYGYLIPAKWQCQAKHSSANIIAWYKTINNAKPANTKTAGKLAFRSNPAAICFFQVNKSIPEGITSYAPGESSRFSLHQYFGAAILKTSEDNFLSLQKLIKAAH